MNGGTWAKRLLRIGSVKFLSPEPVESTMIDPRFCSGYHQVFGDLDVREHFIVLAVTSREQFAMAGTRAGILCRADCHVAGCLLFLFFGCLLLIDVRIGDGLITGAVITKNFEVGQKYVC